MELFWWQTLKNWRTQSHRKFILEESTQKRYERHKNGDKFIFSIADGTAKLLGSVRRGQTVKRLEVYTDSDWASDQVTRKSTSGAVIMVEGMRLHAHSRGQASVALSSCEAEVMAEVLMFVGLGHYEIEIKVDSSAAHAFFHRRGVGRMKHIDSRDCCGRCETEEDTENTKLGGHVDAYTKCEGT